MTASDGSPIFGRMPPPHEAALAPIPSRGLASRAGRRIGSCPSPAAPLAGALALVSALACATTPPGGEGETFKQIQSTSLPARHVHFLGLLTSGQGNLVLTGMETDSLTVSYLVSAANRAGLFPNQVETIDKSDSLLVTIRPAKGSSVDLQVQMPEKLAVELHDEQRAVRFQNIENRVEVLLHGTGSLDFDDIEGPLTIQDGTGSIKIHDTRGPLRIVDQGGGITIDEVKNSVTIEAQAGDIVITNVNKDVNVTAGPGSLTIRGVAGKVSYKKTGTGQVTIENVTGGVEKR